MHAKTQQPESADERVEPTRRGQPLWFWAVLAAMLLAFGFVVIERNVIRSYWWAHRLRHCTDLKQQAYYINALLNVGDAASGAVRAMIVDRRVAVRSAAVLILGQGDSPSQVADLAGMLDDADREVRESAARTLAFLDRSDAETALIDAIASDNTDAAAAAAAGLSRVDTAEAICALCRAISEHFSSLVRAQAVESLGAVLLSSPGAMESAAVEGCDPIVALVTALRDTGGYYGSLALQREIDAARGVAETGDTTAAGHFAGEAMPSSTAFLVAQVARRSIERLLGEPFETPMPQTPEAAAELADSLRRRIAEHRVRIEMPATMPALGPIQP